MAATSNNLKITFASHDSELVDVRQFFIHEAMNELFEVRLNVVAPDDSIDLDSIVGKGAAFKVETPNYLATAPSKVWAGVIAHMAQLHAEPAPAGVSTYQIMLVPNMWRLTLRRNSRIFQHMTTPEIVQKLLAEWQITPTLKLSATYKKHEYCVQYGETDYAFMSRLLEEAGISFYFVNAAVTGKGDEMTKLVLNDAPQKNDQRKAPLAYAGHQTPRFGGDQDFVATVKITQRLRPGKFTVRDFDFRLRPDTPLLAKSASGGREDVYEQYDYNPGVYWWEPGQGGDTPAADDKGVARSDKKESEVMIARDMNAERRRKLVVTFHTNALDLGPGSVMAINQGHDSGNHPRDDLSPKHKLVLTELTFEGEHNGDWNMTAASVFAETAYRPEKKTPRPIVYGVQSAVVVGPAGQDIHTDEFGRVRVQFHWDREGKYDDNSSCWIRVSQAWAGGGFGVIDIPRVGHEVLVDFYEGNPDMPVVVGRVYNATTRTPYALPGNKTQSGWKSDSSPGGGGYNELRFDDAKGGEEIHVQAEKNLSYVVKHSESHDIGSTRSTRVGTTDLLSVGQTRAVKVGVQDSTDVGMTHTISVGPKTGTKMSAQKIVVLSTGDASIKHADKNLFFNAKGEIHLHAEGAFHISSHAGNVKVQGGPMVKINDGSAGPAPKVDTIQAATPPDPPGPGGTSGAPFKPSGGGSIDKPGAFDDVNIGGDDGAPTDGGLSSASAAGLLDHNALQRSAATTPGLASVAKEPIAQIALGISAWGSSDFVAQIRNRVATIASTTSGAQVLSSIAKSGKEALILQDGLVPLTLPTDGLAANGAGRTLYNSTTGAVLFGADGKPLVGTGAGSDSVIQFQTDATMPNSLAPNNPMPNDAALFHELVHASHFANGTANFAPDPSYENMEERTTIAGASPSEATYLAERGYPYHRTDHGLGWAPN